MLTVAIPDDGL